jgi:hypothetical protein
MPVQFTPTCSVVRGARSMCRQPAASRLHSAEMYYIIGSFKVATYLILIFYLTGFYCQIKISNLIEVFKFAIYSYLIDYLL